MIGNRTRYSLVQLLEQQDPALIVALLNKHGAQASLGYCSNAQGLTSAVQSLTDHQLMDVLAEVAATAGDLRFRVNPKYRFDERMHDLKQCLLLDGYELEGRRLRLTDPSIVDAHPIDDDLVEALRVCGAPRSGDVIQKIADSAQAFRATPPDYNATLVNVRVALETLAADVAADVAGGGSLPYNPAKWGEILQFLRANGEITVEEEQGLAGVFKFLSPGAHRPVGIPEGQMTRLGRSFGLNMCWFLLQNRLARRGESVQQGASAVF